MDKNADNSTWTILEQRWQQIIRTAEEKEIAYLQGNAYVRHERQAHTELLKLNKNVAFNTLIETALAMYLFLQDRPRRFKSDSAFDFQLVRRVRGLTNTNAGTYWDDETKRMKHVYKEVPPRTLAHLAAAIKHTFGVAGTFVAKLELQEAEQQNNLQKALHEALEDLK